MNILEKLNKKINEAVNLETLGVIGNTLCLKINGHKYYYERLSDQPLSIEDIEKEFSEKAKSNKGAALVWLRTVSKAIRKDIAGSSPIWTKDNPRYIGESKKLARKILEMFLALKLTSKIVK